METGSFIFRAIQNQRQIRYNVSFGEHLLCNSTSDCLETVLSVHPVVVDCQSELKLFCGSREFYFLKLYKITDRRVGI